MPKNDTKVFVRMPRTVYEALAAQAAKERRSLNAQILVLLERAAQDRDGEHPTIRVSDS